MRRFRWILIAIIVVLLALAGWVWFSPSGSGEYSDSPNGRYRTWASNYRRGTWLQGRVAYIGIEVVENSTGNTIWKAERYALANEMPPEFGDRSNKFIRWAPDSRSVSVPVGGSADAIFAVP